MKKIIFLQSKFPVENQALFQLLYRWKTYREKLKTEDAQADIWIFTLKHFPIESEKLLNEFSLNLIENAKQKTWFFSRLKALREVVVTNKDGITLVCGDNQLDLLIAVGLKLFSVHSIRIQIQFHGDIYSFRTNSGFYGLLRVCLSRVAIHIADSIRVVSKFQFQDINQISSDNRNKLVLAPIPIDFSRVSRISKFIQYDVAFIGRLHVERGISDLIEILTLLFIHKPEIKVVIVGDGPLRHKIEKKLSDWIIDSKISILGFLSVEQIREIYASTKILISTAPHEGYGLTVREAVLSNVCVIARESKGVLEAQQSFPSSIQTYRNCKHAVDLIKLQLEKPRIALKDEFIIDQLNSDEKSLNRLVSSWLLN